MSNQLYKEMGGANSPYSNMFNRFNEFKKTITGNPEEQVRNLLNSGKVTQAQYNAAVQKANALRQFFGV